MKESFTLNTKYFDYNYPILVSYTPHMCQLKYVSSPIEGRRPLKSVGLPACLK